MEKWGAKIKFRKVEFRRKSSLFGPQNTRLFRLTGTLNGELSIELSMVRGLRPKTNFTFYVNLGLSRHFYNHENQ